MTFKEKLHNAIIDNKDWKELVNEEAAKRGLYDCCSFTSVKNPTIKNILAYDSNRLDIDSKYIYSNNMSIYDRELDEWAKPIIHIHKGNGTNNIGCITPLDYSNWCRIDGKFINNDMYRDIYDWLSKPTPYMNTHNSKFIKPHLINRNKNSVKRINKQIKFY